VPIKISIWIALRILPSSQTNPVFGLVGGKPIRASWKSATRCLAAVERCWSQEEPALCCAEKNEARGAYDAIRQASRKIRDEAMEDSSG